MPTLTLDVNSILEKEKWIYVCVCSQFIHVLLLRFDKALDFLSKKIVHVFE